MYSEHLRYLGVLSLLAECSVYLNDDPELRSSIERAMSDAQEAIPGFRWRRILDRIEVEIVFTEPILSVEIAPDV